MKASAPEKIYLEAIYPYNGVLPNGLSYTPSPTNVEYTQTNAFIEKAAKWLEDNAIEYWGTESVDNGMMIDDFKKAMKL